MTISHQFGDVDAHGAAIPAGSASLEAGHQAGVRYEPVAGDFWGRASSAAGQEFITHLGRKFPNDLRAGQRPGQKMQTSASDMASTDSAVGL